jgi:hypothetical protein
VSKVEQIQSAVTGLTKKELAKFRKWFAEFEAEIWDRQFEQDVRAGKLDKLAAQAERQFKAGRCTEL